MSRDEQSSSFVWVFNGNKNRFPSAVFSQRHLAEEWIQANKLEGTLTSYPLNVSVYDWALQHNYFEPKREDQRTPQFIQNFSSAYQEHYHYTANEPGDPC